MLGEEQRLHADPIPGQEEPLRIFLPDRKCKDAVELFQHFPAPLGVAVEQYLGIRMSPEAVAAVDELDAKLLGIVQLSVVDDGIFLAFKPKGHGLPPALYVDDGQPCMEERHILPLKNAEIIRPPAAHGLLHSFDCGWRSLQVQDSRDGAHRHPPFLRLQDMHA